jgi:ribosomal protein L7/L12
MNRKTTIVAVAIAAVAVTAGIISMLQKPSPVRAARPAVSAKTPAAIRTPQAQQVAVARPQPSPVVPADKHGKKNIAEVIEGVRQTDPEVAIREAKLNISNLAVRNVGGIIILRGESDRETAIRAERVVHDAGFPRVANLIQQQAAIDDEAIRRNAERQLAQVRSLDGCRFAVTCERGVLKVNATIQSDLQEDATRLVLKQIQGVKNVQATFARF